MPWTLLLASLALALPRTGPVSWGLDFLTSRVKNRSFTVPDPYGRGSYVIRGHAILMHDFVTIEHHPRIGWSATILQIGESGDIGPSGVTIIPDENEIAIEGLSRDVHVSADEFTKLRWFGPRFISDGQPRPLRWHWLDAVDSVLLAALALAMLRHNRRWLRAARESG